MRERAAPRHRASYSALGWHRPCNREKRGAFAIAINSSFVSLKKNCFMGNIKVKGKMQRVAILNDNRVVGRAFEN